MRLIPLIIANLIVWTVASCRHSPHWHVNAEWFGVDMDTGRQQYEAQRAEAERINQIELP